MRLSVSVDTEIAGHARLQVRVKKITSQQFDSAWRPRSFDALKWIVAAL